MIINWISTINGMPLPYKNVLVAGGCAYWDGTSWYTCMERNHPKIQWRVYYWAPLPSMLDACSGCAALKEELAELKAKIVSMLGITLETVNSFSQEGDNV